jgi:hypothetical protein
VRDEVRGVPRFTYEVTALVRPAPRAGTLADGIAQLLVCLEVVQVDVLAFVGLVGIAFHRFNTTVLALDLVLVGTTLLEAIPPLAVVVSSSALLGPCRLCSSARDLVLVGKVQYAPLYRTSSVP